MGTAHVARQTSHMDKTLITVCTRFWLFVMCLFVPGKLLLRVKHLATMAYIILELLLDVEMMPILVLRQIRISAEGLVT